jgi:hypothetical protein
MNNAQTLQVGCYLDNHRGHYIIRDMIWLAEELGYIIDPAMQFVLEKYEDHSHEDGYPYESIRDEADNALEWLNWQGNVTPMPGQNKPPVIPEGTYWDWQDGDFGLWREDESEF